VGTDSRSKRRKASNHQGELDQGENVPRGTSWALGGWEATADTENFQSQFPRKIRTYDFTHHNDYYRNHILDARGPPASVAWETSPGRAQDRDHQEGPQLPPGSTLAPRGWKGTGEASIVEWRCRRAPRSGGVRDPWHGSFPFPPRRPRCHMRMFFTLWSPVSFSRWAPKLLPIGVPAVPERWFSFVALADGGAGSFVGDGSEAHCSGGS
jgi:hypothetical protein